MTHKPIQVFENGVKKYDLYDFCYADFEEAQRILDIDPAVTGYIDAYSAYSERVENDFVGVYEVAIDRKTDYEAFINKLELDRRASINKAKKEYMEKWNQLRGKTINEFYKEKEKLNQELKQKIDKLKNFRNPTFEEWKNGLYRLNEKQKVKLGKALRKNGFSKELIDFYSAQVKTEKTLYLTISDLPQHVAGMSAYAPFNSWDGWTSCQDPRQGCDEAIHLAGALHDDRLFVGLLHEKLEDIEDMEGKLLARTVFRLLTIGRHQILVATQYYGSVVTKDELHQVIKKLEEINTGIFTNHVVGRGKTERVLNPANGAYEFPIVEDVYFDESFEVEEEIPCPLCKKQKEYVVWIERWNIKAPVKIDCPLCKGKGTYRVTIPIEFCEYVEVEGNLAILPYDELYVHHGKYISMHLNMEKIWQVLAKKREKAIV